VAIAYAPDSLIAQQARIQHIDDLLALAAEAVDQQEWQTGLDDYNQAIELEAALPAEPVVEGYEPRKPTARLKIAELYLAWGQALYADGSYEEAIAKYDIVMADEELNTLAPGANLLAASAWKAWGDVDVKAKELGAAAKKFGHVLDLAPDSTDASDVKKALQAMIPSVLEAVPAGGGCDNVYIIDALLKAKLTTSEVDALIPQALYQCGEEAYAAGHLAEARVNFERVVAKYPDSTYKAKAEAALPRVAWSEKIEAKGLAFAAKDLCSKAKKTVNGDIKSIGLPPNMFISATVSATDWMDALPAEWKGEELFTNLVVCVDKGTAELVEECKYSKIDVFWWGYIIYTWVGYERFRSIDTVRLVDPYTGLTVAVGKITGGAPNKCPATSAFLSPVQNIYGPAPTSADLLVWLKQYFKVIAP
jgi:tetratricopeptide (TPR) repeat protein